MAALKPMALNTCNLLVEAQTNDAPGYDSDGLDKEIAMDSVRFDAQKVREVFNEVSAECSADFREFEYALEPRRIALMIGSSGGLPLLYLPEMWARAWPDTAIEGLLPLPGKTTIKNIRTLPDTFTLMSSHLGWVWSMM